LIKIIIKEENFKWHLEAFASELFIYIYSTHTVYTYTHTHTHRQLWHVSFFFNTFY